jgi:F0F1-type ATP synthase alpha subunit
LELEVFMRFGTMVDDRTRKVIEHGKRIRAVLTQPQFEPLSLGEQVALLAAVSEGLLDTLPLEKLPVFRDRLRPWLADNLPEILALNDQSEVMNEDVRLRLRSTLSALAHTVGALPPRESSA